MHSSQVIESKLGQPDTAASHHSAAVAAFIRERIDSAGGVLPFDEYMEAEQACAERVDDEEAQPTHGKKEKRRLQ